ncbi:type II toxin-antitoxin system ParD family antitoxin [Roseibium sp. RKSG952]|uniref:ribbon-helix-helix domain-containing protein n=1 Tax=Roseibium sp. RKSG952 TaxID=2529384 RepID=UPI0012BC1519|nr:type II toxin-antitoxin system ParD family antitoxin [Roseibium sp. RKSG952]MTI02885.1 ribbon-helix-helix protein, CopG family [Roseibium sp. RKSG952]
MKNVSISLTDHHAAEIDACIATGDYASVSEVVRTALREFLSRGMVPDARQIDHDIAEYLESQRNGERLLSADAAKRDILGALTSDT